MSRTRLVMLALLFSGWQETSFALDAARWQHYQQRFISAEGRVIDNGNGGISHSEGQGYGMLLAVAAGDRATFERLRYWTEANLAVRNDGLLAWRWLPQGKEHTPDLNNATDGDLLVAWALARAARRFDEPLYGQRAATIAAALRRQLTRETSFGSLLLPGATGFEPKQGMVINPSYLIFPAYAELANWDDPAYWQRISQNSESLLQAVMIRYRGLPPDWLILARETMMPAPHAPLRFGFDALRVPLYVCWHGNETRVSLSAIAAHLRSDAAPAWVALNSTERSDIALTSGHRAVRWLLVRCLEPAQARRDASLPPLSEEYYGATLALLAEMAWKERHE